MVTISIIMPVIAKVENISVTTGPVQNVDLYKRYISCTVSALGGKRGAGGFIPGICALPAGVDYKDLWLKVGNQFMKIPHSSQGWTKGSRNPSCGNADRRTCRGCRGGCATSYSGVALLSFGGNKTPRSGTTGRTGYGAYPGHMTKTNTSGSGGYGRRVVNNVGRGNINAYEGYRGTGLAMTHASFKVTGFGFKKYAYAVNGNIFGPLDCPAADSNGKVTLNITIDRGPGELVQVDQNAFQFWGYDSNTTFMVRKCVVF